MAACSIHKKDSLWCIGALITTYKVTAPMMNHSPWFTWIIKITRKIICCNYNMLTCKELGNYRWPHRRQALSRPDEALSCRVVPVGCAYSSPGMTLQGSGWSHTEPTMLVLARLTLNRNQIENYSCNHLFMSLLVGWAMCSYDLCAWAPSDSVQDWWHNMDRTPFSC